MNDHNICHRHHHHVEHHNDRQDDRCYDHRHSRIGIISITINESLLSVS